MDAQQWTIALVSHAIQVTLLVALVAGVTRLWAKNRPHLAHALWLLVLLKCLMPPTWSSPTSIFSWLSANTIHAEPFYSPTNSADSTNLPTSSTPDQASGFIVRHGETVDETVHASASSTPVELNRVGARSSNWHTALRTSLCVIGCGFVLGLVTTLLRLTHFLRSAYASGYREDAELQSKVQQLSQRFGMRHSVRVHVIHRQIGPVVVGWLRPVLLLPDAIVSGKSVTQLEPLIAHELIHIRRGDLWWALLQTLATRLWWFHPLVQWSGRMLTRESERSCDEETVMSLGCSPGDYARALLDVLEHKHRLQTAPALPGVRPVDITLKRMERIMQLGHGSHQRSPRWIWLLLFIASAVALPSAAITQAQDQPPPDQKSSEAPVPTAVPPATGPIAEAFASYRCDVGDLLDLLKARNINEAEAKQKLLEQIPARQAAHLTEVVSKLGLPSPVSIHLPDPSITGRELYVFELKAQIEAIKATLAQLRKSGFEQVTCQVQLINCSPARYQSLIKTWRLQKRFEPDFEFLSPAITGSKIRFETFETGTLVWQNSQGILIGRGKWTSGTDNGSTSKRTNFDWPEVVVLDAAEAESLKNQPEFNVLSAPRIAGTSGQSMSLSMRSDKPTYGSAANATWEHVKMELKPLVLQDDSIDLSFEMNTQRSPLTVVTELNSDPAAKNAVWLRFKESIASGQTLVFGGIPTKVKGEDRVLFVCVTPTLGGLDGKNIKFKPILKARAGEKAPTTFILGQVTTADKPEKFEPPTNDELAFALRNLREPGVGIPPAHTFQFQLEKIEDRIDPARFVPLIGMAQLHHMIYKCTFTRDECPGVIETFIVDHNRFETTTEK